MNKYDGQTSSSWGYYAKNGFRVPGHATFSEPYGEPWETGDVVGCGFNVKEKRIYFVKNRKYQGVFNHVENLENCVLTTLPGIAFEGVHGQLFPMVGLAGGGVRLKGRFGVEPPQKI
jgi:hypothetical protein